jgi:hypothetical protein
MSLSSLIVQREVATIRQVEEALARQVLYGGDLVTNLLEVAQLDEVVLVNLLAESVGLPTAPLGELPQPSEKARSLVPPDLATRRALMPVAFESGRLVVAVAEPLTPEVLEELCFALGTQIEQRIAPMVRIRQALAAVYDAPLERRMQRLIGRLAGIDVVDPGSLPPLLRNVPTVTGPPRPASNPPSVPRHETPALGSVHFPSHHATETGFPGMPPPRPTESGLPAPPPSLLDELTEPTRPVDLEAMLERPTEPAPPMPGLSELPITVPNRAGHEPVAAPPAAHGALVQMAQRESSPPRTRRRRGPLTLDRAKAELESANDRDALLDLFFDFARQYFEYSAFFIVHSDIAEGRDAYGPGAPRDRVVGIGVPLELPSAFATARERRVPIVAWPSAHGMDQVLLADLQRSSGAPVLVIPIIVRGRAVGLLYGDNGEAGVDGVGQGEVAAFAALVGQGFERIIVRRKLQGFTSGDQTSSVARVDAKRLSRKPSRPAPDRTTAVEALERALLVRAEADPAVARAGRVPSERPSTRPEREAGRARSQRAGTSSVPPLVAHPTHRDLPSFPQPPAVAVGPAGTEEQSVDSAGEYSELPPPPQVAAVRELNRPPIPREEPEPALALELTPAAAEAEAAELPDVAHPKSRKPRDAADAIATVEPTFGVAEDQLTPPSGERTIESLLSTASPLASEGALPPSSQAVAVPPHKPPSSRGYPEPLPSVIVDVEREFATLVARLIENQHDEQAEAELLRQGQYAMPAIMTRFPGPITISRERLDEIPMPRVGECGPILRLIAGQRRVALPFVLPFVDDPDIERSFWATYLLTELAYAEAVPAVVARLFDESDRTRRVARLAAKAVAEVAREALVEELDRIARDPEASSAKRVATVDTLGEMRDALVVPVLIGALTDEDEEVAPAARRALMMVSRQDFGRDTRRWLAWWASNSSRHRIEWLIDALTHEVPAMRRIAGQELKALTKEYFGYYDDLPKRERERAQQRYRDWWKTEGRARFRRS